MSFRLFVVPSLGQRLVACLALPVQLAALFEALDEVLVSLSLGGGQCSDRERGRLASLVPRPREHQLTYHGVLAPAAPWRALIGIPDTETEQLPVTLLEAMACGLPACGTDVGDLRVTCRREDSASSRLRGLRRP